MFYSQFILAKKGPLGTIWIAAHLERKLRKNQVADTDIGVSVDSIICPEVPIALRLSSHLLLGVVRIYSKKVNYLFDDCSEALLKVKQAFRSEAVDLPPEQSKAPYHSITLPETFDLDDFELPDTDVINGSYVDHHVSAREHITLQDPMEGVVFTTSQFGLDERFGDGDAFQIGLDLDEEMLLDKGGPSSRGKDIMDSLSYADSSVEGSSLLKDAKSDEEINESSVATEANFFTIQAPSTPGLLEEPNLPIAEDAQVSDDHMDEDQNSTEIVAKESLGADFSKPESYSVDYGIVSSPLKAHVHLEAMKASSHEFPPLTDEVLKYAPSEIARLPLVNENPLSNGSEETRILCIQAPNGEGLNASSGFRSIEVHEGEAMQIRSSMFADNQSPAHEAAGAPLDLRACCPCSSLADLVPGNDNTFAKSGVPTTVENNGNTRGNTSQLSNTDSLDCQKSGKHESAVGRLVSASEQLLQACSSHLKYADALSDLISSSHPACCSSSGAESADHPNLDRRNVSLVPSDSICEKGIGDLVSDLPYPEKLLSVPDDIRINSLLVQSTPETEIITQADGDSTANMLTGKKRSFIESAVTFQSETSVESSAAAAQSTKSLELVPNDDDLLSSILVGRRSTALRLKPTPSIQDTESMKRRRVTPRTTPYKRKVLMDDSMVLHGDTIRQQLINTEDIRRLRKKAPCTRSEIWVLQKQSLEDEIFSDPLVSGVSADLISLHSQPFDLSAIKIIMDEMATAHQAEVNGSGSSLRPKDEENVIDTNNLDSVDRDITNCLEENMNERCINASFGHQPSQQDAFRENPESENEGRSILAGKKADNVGTLSENLSSVNSMLLKEDNSTDHATVLLASLTKPKDAGVSICDDVAVPVQTDELLQSTDQGMDAQTTNLVIAADVSAIKSNNGEIIDNELAGRSNKGESGQRTDEDWVKEQMEGFDSFAATIGINLDQSLRLDYASVFAAMSPQIRSLAASDQALIDKPADQCESTHGDEILGSKQHEDNAFEHCDVDSRLDCSAVEGDLDWGSSTPAEKVDVELLGAIDQSFVDPASVSNQSIMGDHVLDFDKESFKHDTDFLNYDDEDDENADDGDNSVPNAEEAGMQETIGWSARTRAVANYLQVLFHKGAQQGRNVVDLDNLLAGKSRKEASRMFFETLVLKTRDCIHVEQEQPFCDISIKPRHQLMKSDF
ncbi:Sister chromatid cohesion 1 protein 4-like protein [Drosera capensis]